MSLKHHKFRAARSARSNANAITPDQLAHELNNLLDGSLRGVGMTKRQLDGLPVDDDTRGQLKKYLDTADHSMRRMVDVIERYANQPRDEAGPMHDLLHASGCLLEALTHAVNVYGPALEQRGIEVVTRLDPEVSDLPAGPIYTVLANAINNALQAIERDEHSSKDDAPHRITVRLVRDPREAQHLLIEVIDTGVGLDPKLIDDRGRFRFGVTTRPQGHGVGLGVCRQIAEDLGGQLSIKPNAEAGVCFSMTYPLPGADRRRTFDQSPEPRRAG